MAARIVYDGLGSGGHLFEGKKFYILQRVPDRNRWTGLVEANGGEVVKIEKQADIIIADHARKDAPPGSLSWKFIEASVKKGSLDDIENYRAGPATHVVREVGSKQPARRGRTPFTTEDDRVLLEWCTRGEMKGISLKGNELYQQLEEKNNRHTFQSWRDRWIKYLSHLPRAVLPDEDEEGEAPMPRTSPQRRPPRDRRHTAAEALQAVPLRLPASPTSARSRKPVEESTPPPQASVGISAGGNIFTQEETDLLLNAYDDILNLSDDQVIDAWIAWSTEYNNHTAQEWRNYFKEYIVPKKSEEKKKKERHLSQRSPTASSAHLESTPKLKNSKLRHLRHPEVQESQESPHYAEVSPEPERRKADPTLTNEQEFREDLKLLAEEFKVELDFDPLICGRKVPLFKMWQIVQSEEFGGFDVVTGRNMWPKVANRLNFNEFRHSTAAKDLKDCYSEILADFANVRALYEDELGLTESQEKELIEQQLHITATRETQSAQEHPVGEKSGVNVSAVEEDDEEELDDDLDSPQFTPKQPAASSSSKRSFGTDRTNHDAGYNKRQRIDKGKGKEREIPSTPEDLINSFQMLPPSHKQSPLKKVSTVGQEDEQSDDSSDLEELFVKPIKFPPSVRKPPTRPYGLEPETQDFHFPPEFTDEVKAELEEDGGNGSLSWPSSPQVIHEKSNNSNPATRGSAQSSMNLHDSSTQSQTESERIAALQDYIDHNVSLGYPQDVVIEALEATSMYPEHAHFVMESLMNGDGIPEDINGVWTTLDDEALDAKVESDQFRDIVRKHGLNQCRVRRRFLKEQKELSDEIETEEQAGG